MVEDDGTYGAINGCTGRRRKYTKGHFKQHDLFMYHISREWNCLPSSKYIHTYVHTCSLSPMFQSYNLLLSCFSFSPLPLNPLLGTLILLEDYQIQILETLWCTILSSGPRGLKYCEILFRNEEHVFVKKNFKWTYCNSKLDERGLLFYNPAETLNYIQSFSRTWLWKFQF